MGLPRTFKLIQYLIISIILTVVLTREVDADADSPQDWTQQDSRKISPCYMTSCETKPKCDDGFMKFDFDENGCTKSGHERFFCCPKGQNKPSCFTTSCKITSACPAGYNADFAYEGSSGDCRKDHWVKTTCCIDTDKAEL